MEHTSATFMLYFQEAELVSKPKNRSSRDKLTPLLKRLNRAEYWVGFSEEAGYMNKPCGVSNTIELILT